MKLQFQKDHVEKRNENGGPVGAGGGEGRSLCKFQPGQQIEEACFVI